MVRGKKRASPMWSVLFYEPLDCVLETLIPEGLLMAHQM